MKHNLKIILFLVFTFLVSQAIGLSITNNYIDHKATAETGNVTWSSLPYDIERPEVEESTSFLYIMLAILLGTLLVFLIIKFGKVIWWKLWFFLAVSITLVVAFKAFMPQLIAAILAVTLAGYKIFRPNMIIHNVTELFIYGGLAAIFVPIINLFSVLMLLLLISVYDMIAVWKSKHMVSLAKFQTKAKVFAGLLIPYRKERTISTDKKLSKKMLKKVELKNSEVKTAILGGGDIGFPLLFAGVLMKNLMLVNPVWLGFLKTMIIPLFASVALLLLFIYSKKDKFYPAMPFLTAGCLAGYGVLYLVNMFI